MLILGNPSKSAVGDTWECSWISRFYLALPSTYVTMGAIESLYAPMSFLDAVHVGGAVNRFKARHHANTHC